METITKYIEERRVHALIDGHGPPLVLFHASPMNSSSLIPLMELLSDSYTVIALDTPGYGQSDHPKDEPNRISDYVDIIDKFRTELGITQLALYGTATGGQIAIRYGLEKPGLIKHIFLDNVAHFSPEMASKVKKDYFPSLRPELSGSHLITTWDIVRNLFKFFPWCCQEEKFKIQSAEPPLAVLHKVALLYLKAGERYDWAYKLAFDHERHEYLSQLKVPTTIFRWDLSIVKAFTDDLFEIGLPDHVQGHVISAEENRYKAMSVYIKEKYKGTDCDALIIQKKPLQVVHSNFDMLFPSPEPSGEYLINAWNRLRATEGNSTLENLNQQFINWASSI